MDAERAKPAAAPISPGGKHPWGPAGGLRTDTLVDSVLILLALTVVQRLVGFSRAVLFCRWLDAEELGRWDMAFAFLLLAAPLAVLALPGTFGRYVERYRRRGELRSFLRRTATACAVMAVGAVGLVATGRSWFSQLVFGTPDYADLILLLAVSLVAVIGYNFLVELFTALRSVRLVCGMQLANSLAFASLGACLLLCWKCTAAGVVIAYGGACLIVSGAGLWYLRRAWRASSPSGAGPQPQGALWAKLLPFAAWILAINLLTNLFDVVDRYMIVHCWPGSAGEALTVVGQYHSSRVVPVLLVSISAMLATVVLPHLSHDWEAGRRGWVCEQLNLLVKLLSFALTAAAVVVLFAAPLLFGVAFEGKFAGGLAVLPWTLTYCVWFGIAMVAQSYLWCAEKAHLAGVAMAIGLLLNVILNLLLLPRLGLLGAVLATSAANLVALVLMLWFDRLLGLRIDRGIWVLLAAPLALCLGPWIASLVLAAIVLEVAGSERLLSRQEKRRVAQGWTDYLERFRSLWLRRSVVGD